MSNNRLYINIGDWYKAAKENSADIQSKDDIVRLIRDGHSPRQVGQWLVALIQNEESPPELLPSVKELLGEGAYQHVLLVIRTTKERIIYQANNGEEREMYVRSLNHWGGRLIDAEPEIAEDDGADTAEAYESGYAGIGDPAYLENATIRLHGQAWGSVKSALQQIKVSNGDTATQWDEFKQKGDDLIADWANGG